METERLSSYEQVHRHVEKASRNGNGLHHEAAIPEEQFLVRVSHLPMVAASLGRLSHLYNQTKLSNALLAQVLDKGEETALSSLALATVLASKTGLQGPLTKADAAACNLLDKAEEKLPIITYTPEEIVDSGRRARDAQLERLQQLKSNAQQRLLELQQSALAIGTSVLNAPAQTVSKSVGWGLHQADVWIDRFLPHDHTIPNGHGVQNTINGENGNMEQARLLSEKLRERLLTRLRQNIQTAQLLSQALQLIEVVKERSAASAHSVQVALENIYNAKDDEALETDSRNEHDGSTLLQRVKGLSGQLKDALENTGTQLTSLLPLSLQERLHSSTEYAGDLFRQFSQAQSLEELPGSLIKQAREYVTTLQGTMNAALDVLTETYLLKWLIPEYNNIGSLDIHLQ